MSDVVEEMLAAAVHMAELNEVPAKVTVARWRKELLKRGDEPRNPSSEAGLREACTQSLAEHEAIYEVMMLDPRNRGMKPPAIIATLRAALAKEARDAGADFNAIAQNIVDVWCSLFPREVANTHRIDLQRRIADALFRVRNNLQISDIPAAARDAAKETT